jgi:acylphosphatase
MLQTIRIIVSGEVQGVNYRASARNAATELGISGTTRNLQNGDVEIHATGTKEQLDKFITWCRKGPAIAKVSQVQTTELPLQVFDGFSIVR